MPVSAETLHDWHAREGALQRLVPPWEAVELAEHTGTIADSRVVMRMGVMGPIRQTWVAQHSDHVPGRQFRDTQVSGPFAAWVHTHRFEPNEAGSELVDHIDYTLPMGPLGSLFGGAFALARIERMFDFRHQRTAEDLSRHAGKAPMRVAVTGASGLIGTQLCAFLSTGGHTVQKLVRRSAGQGEIRWDPAKGEIDVAALEGVDAVVHLAGENVGQRWTPAVKEAVMASRVSGTRTIATALAKLQKKPRIFVSASAVGYYGDTGDTMADESSPAGTGFLAEVCQAWEASADPARDAGIPVVHPRIGVVLAAAGGALAEMKTPFAFGVGGPIGSGKQWFPWISMDDAVGAIHHLLYAGLTGPVNVVGPESVRQAEFAAVLGKVLSRPAFLPLPGFAVRTVFGEMGQGVLIEGQRVAPKRLLESGFRYVRPDLEAALRFELGK